VEEGLVIELRVHGYHVYNNIWEVAVGKPLRSSCWETGKVAVGKE